MDDYSERVDTIKKLLDEGDKNIVIPSNINNSIIFLGHSGSGKSTLFNYLIGTPLVAKAAVSKISNQLVIDTDSNYSISNINHTTMSGTTIPKIHIYNDTLYIDCPGFGDNRGCGQDIANAYYIKKALNATSNIRLVIVIELEMLKGKVQKFLELLEILCEMFQDISQIKSGITTVISKVDRNIPISAIMEQLQTIRIEHIETLSNFQLFFMDTLIGLGDRIVLFHQPINVGPLTDDDLNHMIQTLSTIQPIRSTAIKMSVSDKSKVFVTELLTRSYNKIIELNDKLCNSIDTIMTDTDNHLSQTIDKEIDNVRRGVTSTSVVFDWLLNCSKTMQHMSDAEIYNVDDMIHIETGTNNINCAHNIKAEINRFKIFFELNSTKQLNYHKHCINTVKRCVDKMNQKIQKLQQNLKSKIVTDTTKNLLDFLSEILDQYVATSYRLQSSWSTAEGLEELFKFGRRIQKMNDTLLSNETHVIYSKDIYLLNSDRFNVINARLIINQKILERYTNDLIVNEHVKYISECFENTVNSKIKQLIKKETSKCTIL